LEIAAKPISPVPLRELVVSADLIILAEVTDVEGSYCRSPAGAATGFAETRSSATQSARQCTPGALPVAVLKVRRTLKGAAVTDRVRVPFEGNLICPAPPRYVKGETVLAFLCRDEPTREWRTCALSYGTKVLEGAAALQAYIQRTAEIVDVCKIQDEGERSRATAAWLIRCIADPATRWEGAYDLWRSQDAWYQEKYTRLAQRAKDGEESAGRAIANALAPQDFFPYFDADQRWTLVNATADEEREDEARFLDLVRTLVHSRNARMYDTAHKWLAQTTDRKAAARWLSAFLGEAVRLLGTQWQEKDEAGATVPLQGERDRLVQRLRRLEHMFKGTGNLKTRVTLLDEIFALLSEQLCATGVPGVRAGPVPR
jgi:hypothetical protein